MALMFVAIPALAAVNGASSYPSVCPLCNRGGGSCKLDPKGSTYFHYTTCTCGNYYKQRHVDSNNDGNCERCGGYVDLT